ncbi:hypothetical protein DES42_10257 [Zavarzinia compransoris]|nr:hypothetical protein DES42_10257 [Zavarzinia compransoris]
MRQSIFLPIAALGLVGLSACAKIHDPRQHTPNNAFYYKAGAEPLARCLYRAGRVADRCGIFALALGLEEDGKTYTVRCYRNEAAQPGAGAAGAGVMGFIVGQAIDRAMRDTFDDDLNRNTFFMAGLRDVGENLVQVRLWFGPVAFHSEARFRDVKESLDKCAGAGPLDPPPANVPPPVALRPTTVPAGTSIDPGTLGRGAAPAAPAAPKTEGKTTP